MQHSKEPLTCAVCGRRLPRRLCTPASALRPSLAERLRKAHPGLGAEGHVCHEDLSRIRGEWVSEMLQAQKGELSRINGLSGQLQKWLDDLQKYAPPEAPDPAAEEKRWRYASDSAVKKIRAGVAEARKEIAALMGRPFPSDANVVARGQPASASG